MLFMLVNSFVQPATLDALRLCLGSVRQHHPDASLVVIDGAWQHTELHAELLAAYGACTERARHPGCGEVNCILWTMDHAVAAPADAEDRYVVLQDTTHLSAPLPLLPRPDSPLFAPLWYASSSITDDLGHPEVATAVRVDGVDVSADVAAAGATGEVIFGAMATWSTAFARLLGERTTLAAAAPVFNSKSRRCMMERVLFFVARRLNAVPATRDAFRASALLGDILRHPQAFRNRTPHAARGVFPATKMWLGR